MSNIEKTAATLYNHWRRNSPMVEKWESATPALQATFRGQAQALVDAEIVVYTREDLESLPAGSILRDKNGDPILKGTGSCVGTGDGPPIELAIDEYLPATVLYIPENAE